METKTTNRTRIALIAVSLLLVLGVSASCTLGALALRRISEQDAALSEIQGQFSAAFGGDDTVTQEDDVAVGGEYYIRSTLPISEAYISGDSSGLDERQAETLELASAVLDGIIGEGMTDYEKEKAVYDWMCSNIGHEAGVTVLVPTASEYSADPYGVLKYRAAVCVGYATTFRLFMQMLGMDCKVVHNSYHSWNLVRLDDGEWYHVDVYSDAGRGDYANFNMTDAMCEYGHDWDRGFFPAAVGLAYCYAYQNAEPLADLCELPAIVRSALDEGGSRGLYYLLGDDSQETQNEASELYNRLSDAISAYGAAAGRDLYVDWNMQLVENSLLLSVVINDYDEEPEEPVVGDVAYERIDSAISDAFGDVYTGSSTGTDLDWDFTVDAIPEVSA